MTTQDLIQKHLPEGLRKVVKNHEISEKHIIQNSDLIILILESRSLAKAEDKQNWFDMFSIMNTEQMDKLKDILTREKNKLKSIEEKYENKKQELKKKYKERFAMYVDNKKKKEIQHKETHVRAIEIQEAESLLDNI